MSVVGDRQAIIYAVKGRRSIRRFLPTPVADETVLEIIEIAARAPSGQNMQPWLIHFVTGETRDALCRQVTEAADSGDRQRLVEGKGVSVRVDLVGGRRIKKKI